MTIDSLFLRFPTNRTTKLVDTTIRHCTCSKHKQFIKDFVCVSLVIEEMGAEASVEIAKPFVDVSKCKVEYDMRLSHHSTPILRFARFRVPFSIR